MAAGARCGAPTARSSCFGVERYAVFHPLTLTAELRFDNGKTSVFQVHSHRLASRAEWSQDEMTPTAS